MLWQWAVRKMVWTAASKVVRQTLMEQAARMREQRPAEPVKPVEPEPGPMSNNWFTKLCRNTGLMIHNTVQPVKEESQRQEVHRETEEKQINENVTLRRTTIDEIEVKRGQEDETGGNASS